MRPLSRDELFFCKHTGEYSKSQQAAGAGLTPAIRLQPDPDRDKVRSLKLMRCVLVQMLFARRCFFFVLLALRAVCWLVSKAVLVSSSFDWHHRLSSLFGT